MGSVGSGLLYLQQVSSWRDGFKGRAQLTGGEEGIRVDLEVRADGPGSSGGVVSCQGLCEAWQAWLGAAAGFMVMSLLPDPGIGLTAAGRICPKGYLLLCKPSWRPSSFQP